MPEIDHLTKSRLKDVGKSLADLSRALGVTYNNLCAMVNGYRWPDLELQRRIREQLKRWETEKETRIK